MSGATSGGARGGGGADLAGVRLIICDIDGTLGDTLADNPTPFRRTPYDWIWYLGRAAQLLEEHAAGRLLGVASNQGGLAFGHRYGLLDADSTPEQLQRAFAAAITGQLCQGFLVAGWPGEVLMVGGVALNTPLSYIGLCFTHPDARVPFFRAAPGDDMRKPGPGMLRAAMRSTGCAPEETLFVGDMPTDRAAAEAAGCRYLDEAAYFRDPPPEWALAKRALYAAEEAERAARRAGRTPPAPF